MAMRNPLQQLQRYIADSTTENVKGTYFFHQTISADSLRNALNYHTTLIFENPMSSTVKRTKAAIKDASAQ